MFIVFDGKCLLLVSVLLIYFHWHSPLVAGLHVVDLNLNYIQIQHKTFCSTLRLLGDSRENIFMPRKTAEQTASTVRAVESLLALSRCSALKNVPVSAAHQPDSGAQSMEGGKKGSFHRPTVTISRQRIVMGVE